MSAGFALGAGAGRGEIDYTRSVLATTFSQHRHYEQVLPMFEALAQVDGRSAFDCKFHLAPEPPCQLPPASGCASYTSNNSH